ncbi:MAG: hypothetical protein AAGI07_07435 [Bacteroidota bacterium]
MRRWPNSLSIDRNQKYALIAEQDGPASYDVKYLQEITKASQLTLVDIGNPKNITQLDRKVFPHIPTVVAFHPKENFFALSFIGSDSIAIGTITDDGIQILNYSKIALPDESIPAIPHFTWHPSGKFAAITLASNDKLMFLRFDKESETWLKPWGNVLKTSPLPGVGYFTHNGKFFVMTNINLTSDLEQDAYAENESLLCIYRFDGTLMPDSPRTRANDGKPTYTSPKIKHTKTANLAFGKGYVETFAISPNDKYLIGLNMRASWLPESYLGKTTSSELSLFKLDAEKGKANLISTYPFDGILPECIQFDKTGESIVVANFDHNKIENDKGSLAFWRLIETNNEPVLIYLKSHFMPRGAHYMVVD